MNEPIRKLGTCMSSTASTSGYLFRVTLHKGCCCRNYKCICIMRIERFRYKHVSLPLGALSASFTTHKLLDLAYKARRMLTCINNFPLSICAGTQMYTTTLEGKFSTSIPSIQKEKTEKLQLRNIVYRS